VEKRAYPRYKVLGLTGFFGRITSPPRSWQVVTFAQGGCGFYGVDNEPSADLNQRIYCEFAWDKAGTDQIQVQGRLVSAVPVCVNEKDVVFYGIEFVPAHQELVVPIVKELERILAADQKV